MISLTEFSPQLFFWDSQTHFMSGYARVGFFFASSTTVREIKRLAVVAAAKQINLTTITVWPPMDAKSYRHGTDQAHIGERCRHTNNVHCLKLQR